MSKKIILALLLDLPELLSSKYKVVSKYKVGNYLIPLSC